MPDRIDIARRERVLICAPFGRDAALIERELTAVGIAAQVCDSIETLAAGIRDGAGAGLIADEALSPAAVECLRKTLDAQPPWSDFPLVVMTSGGNTTHQSRYRLRLLGPLGNVSLLERPLRSATLVSSIQAALRARRRQYELGSLLHQRQMIELELQARNQQLMSANRELEEFAYVSSHDLKEPLRMVNIYTQLLLKDYAAKDEKAQQYAAFIQDGVSRMEKLLYDLLNYSRTVYAEGENTERADLSKSLVQALAMLNGHIKESQAQIEYGQLPVVAGDEGQLAQVFQNLISNAIKYRKNDVPLKITLSAEHTGHDWKITFSDNGIGFDPRYSERIFGLFKRLHKAEYPGTGLGLAICQRIIERYGGRIWAEGRPGQGATFYFTLPDANRQLLGA
jgi:signal transduction histidine kinase